MNYVLTEKHVVLSNIGSKAVERAYKYRPYPKAHWYGRCVVVDRFYPSPKMCSVCGWIAEKLQLNIRDWTCCCGASHDRDVNAAKNIRAAGLAVLACGDGVIPPRS